MNCNYYIFFLEIIGERPCVLPNKQIKCYRADIWVRPYIF